MSNVDIRVPSQDRAISQGKCRKALLRLLRVRIGMVRGGRDREVPRSPAGMEFVRLGVELIELLALQRRDL